MPYDLLSEPIEGVQRRTHRSLSRCASIAADFRRQINQRNDDSKCAEELTDCTNRFPIHGMVMMIAGVQDSSMTSWPDYVASGNQKRF
jgi:hypothetical protein